jgi:alpha-ketoglutarate-dependent taurine dioxygenase
MKHKMTPMKPFGLLLEPNIDFEGVDVIDIVKLRELAREKHLIVLRGFRTFQSTETFANYCAQWGEISIWPFGKVLELVEHDNPEDHIFDNSYIPLHWDGMYRKQIPEFQMFHCIKAPLLGQGGRTTFSNTVLALQHASSQLKQIWQKVTGIYQRKMEFYHSKTVSPIITQHPFSEFSVIRYNEPPSDAAHFINPPDLEFSGVSLEELEEFHHHLKQALYSSKNFYAHEWHRGDIVIADNFSLLHGREKFAAKSPRHLQRVHILSDPPLDNPGLESYNEHRNH